MSKVKPAAFGPHETYVGVDVGKSFHWAYVLDAATGEPRESRCVRNREGDVDRLLREFGDGALVVVDQKNNIGALVVRRCRELGVDVGYMPGITMKRARDMYPGLAKNDEMDAELIARTAMGMRHVVLPIAESDDLGASLSLLSSQLAYATKCATQARNRLHAVLMEADPALEAGLDLGCAWQLALLSRHGGARAIRAAGRASFSQVASRHGAGAASRDALWEAVVASAARWHPEAEDHLVRALASQIGALDAQRASLEAEISGRVSGDETYRCLLTVPGIGPKTATALVTLVDPSLFGSDDRLASYCGVAPEDRRSGTSVSSTGAARKGNKALKNLLVFSCNSLVGTKNRFGRYYDECKSRGMPHNKALKAVARKRLGVIYAIMRDRVPYAEPPEPRSADGEKCSKLAS